MRLSSRPRSRSFRTLAALATTALAITGLAACSGGSSNKSDTITFAAVPTESSQSLESSFDKVIEVIEKATGKDVTFQSVTDYAAVIEGQRAGQIDIASYGPFGYVIAKSGGVDIEAVAAPTNDKAKAPAYTSLAYVKKGSDIRSLSDIAGRKVCFVDAASTSGYLVPSQGLLEEKIDPKTGVEGIMAGGHDASLLSVESGECEVGFAHDAALKTLNNTGQIPEGDLVPIWESAPIPEDPIALNIATLDSADVDSIRTALQTKANKPAMVADGICSSEEDCVLPEEIEWGYLPVSDADYDPIRDVCTVTKADACKGI